MKKRITTAVCLGMMCLTALAQISQRKTLFDQGWEFSKDNGPSRIVELPHDWSIEGTPYAEAPMGNDGGYFPDGKGVYKKTFTVPESEKGRIQSLYFEGVYMDAEVIINGNSLGIHHYGYTSFLKDLTPYIKYGEQNTIEVKVDNSKQKNCRWYSGSGIYRHVWLYSTDAVHFAHWGTKITTPEIDQVKGATVKVSTTIENSSDQVRNIEVSALLKSQNTKTAIQLDAAAKVTIPAHSTQNVELTGKVLNPQLWTPDTPNLYDMELSVQEDGKVLDSYTQAMGIRTIEYTVDKGFLLNGKPMNIFGGCVHHDNGMMGSAAYDTAEEWRVSLMKQAGFNAVRTSHNPPSETFLNACDKMGLMVIDEAFDGWRDEKNTYDYHTLIDTFWKEDLYSMVMRDVNHPSIICWSIGNEIIERKKLEILATTKKLADYCRELDPTRPVTQALATWDSDWEIYDPLAALHEVVGYNYVIQFAEKDHQRVPNRIMWQTESFPRHAFQNWCAVNDHSYVVGDFVWTAIDYQGESGIGRYYYEGETPGEHYEGLQFPWHGAYCGDIDITGFRKPISEYRRILFNPGNNKMSLAVREPNGYYGNIKETSWSVWPTWYSWDWPSWEGKNIEVEVSSRYDAVRLYLNNELIAEKPTTRNEAFQAVFSIPYQPGTLRAEGIENGKVVCTQEISTPGKPAGIRISTPDICNNKKHANGQDLQICYIDIIDAKGNICPRAAEELTFEVSGPATLVAAGNGDLKDLDSYIDNQHKTWKGRAMVVLRSQYKAGSVTLTVKGKGLKTQKYNYKLVK